MDNNNNISPQSAYLETLENDNPATLLVVILPLFFLAIFISFLLIALNKSDEKRENIIRIISYILIQFVCLPFLIAFVILNLVLISLSFLCFKKLNYISAKKAYEYFKGLFGCFSNKDITTIKIGKKVHNVSNALRSDNYKDVNDNSKTIDNPLHLNKFTDNLNLNKTSNNSSNNSNALSNNTNTNNNKNEHNNHLLINANKNLNNHLRATAIAHSNLNNLESNLNCENDNEKNLSRLEKLNKDNKDSSNANNIINNNLNYNNDSNLVKSESTNNNNNINNNLNLDNKLDNFEKDSNSNQQGNKVNIFMSLNDSRPQPVNKKANKSKIMDFLSNVLVQKDNTPSYINLFKNIKHKSKEKLEKREGNSVVIFHK